MLRIITAAALFVFTATAANAGDAPPSTIVNFSDLNLSHPADAKVLAGRLEAAARQVCREEGSGQLGVAAMHEMRACANAAVDAALAHIASAQTSAVKVYLADARAEP